MRGSVSNTILCADPRASYLAHRSEIDEAISAVLDGGRYVLGENVAAFESEFARYIGVAHCVGVASGTDALMIALLACGVGRGDEVLTVAHTAVATVAAIEMCGATPVLVDIEREHCTMDAAELEGAITARTKAVIPVHIYGHPADMSAILSVARRHGLSVIEDCAQSHGATYRGTRVGALGEIAAFSFYPTKNLGALGDAGLVATSDPELARRARLLRQYGWEPRDVSQIPGWNSRLDELQASVLRVKLRHLDAGNAARLRIAGLYRDLLSDTSITLPSVRDDSTHAFHLYVARSRQRDRLRERLAQEGIATLIHYPTPVHLQPAYRGRLAPAGTLPVTEAAAREVLSLPMYPELGDDQVRRVAEAVRRAEEAS